MRLWTNRGLALLLFSLLLASALYVVLEKRASHPARFAYYRPSTAEFHVGRAAFLDDRLDLTHDATVVVPFGVAGDIGLVCPQKDREDPHGYRVFAQGRWFLSGKAKRPPSGDLAFGKPGDLPFCADFNGDGIADSGFFRDGTWLVATQRNATNAYIQFSFGTAGDRPVALNVAGAGNTSDRKNVVYGVYRQGLWYIDSKGTGAVTATHAFGGLPQDLPLLIPRRSNDAHATPAYSLALFRDGTWFIKPDPDGSETLSFGFGQAGDLPSIDY